MRKREWIAAKKGAQFRIKTAQKTDEHSKIFPDMIRFLKLHLKWNWNWSYEVVVVLVQKRLQHVRSCPTFLIIVLIFFSHRGFLFWKKERRRKDTFRSSPSLSSHPLFPIYRNGNKIGICNTICIILCKNLGIKSSKRVCQSTSVFSTIFWQFQV